MGLVFSCDSKHQIIARFEKDTAYLGYTTQFLGRYVNGKVYDNRGLAVASYGNNTLYALDDDKVSFSFVNDVIYNGNTPYASFQGDAVGACAAAYLYYRTQCADDISKTHVGEPFHKCNNGYWTFMDLCENIITRTSTLVKLLLAFIFLSAGYAIFQVPSMIAFLFEEDFIGWLTICIWGGAFLFNFWNKTHPSFYDFRGVFVWLWKFLIPYLHIMWIETVMVCIYAIIDGYFSFSFFARIISLLPNTIVLTLPLYLLNLVCSLYFHYRKQK